MFFNLFIRRHSITSTIIRNPMKSILKKNPCFIYKESIKSNVISHFVTFVTFDESSDKYFYWTSILDICHCFSIYFKFIEWWKSIPHFYRNCNCWHSVKKLKVTSRYEFIRQSIFTILHFKNVISNIIKVTMFPQIINYW